MNFFKRNEYTILQFVAFFFLGIGIMILIWFVILVSMNYERSADFDLPITQTVGTFIGGVVPVFISIATVLLVYITFKSNREEFNKINEANTFQQFNTTFDSMYISLKTIIEEYLDREIHNRNVFKIYTESIKDDWFRRVNDNYNMEKEYLYELVEEQRKEIEYNEFGSDMRYFNKAIKILFDNIEKTSSNYKEFYIHKVKNLFLKNEVQETLMHNGFIDLELKSIIEKYGLISEIEKSINFPIGIIGHIDRPFEGVYLKYELTHFYAESAFE